MVRSQQDTAALPASRPFAVGQAGYDYFADEQHYRSLADRVLAGLRQGGRIVLVTGDPPVNLSSLAAALTEATAGKHTVLAIACGGEFNEQELRRAAGPSPLILFHQAERLLDGQLAKLCSYLASGGNRPAGVLLGVPGLVPRLEKLQPSLFEDGRAIRFNFYELGRDEIDVFMRRQLRQSSAAGGFAVDEINWIADLSSGDPAQVNRLSRLMLELTGGVGGSDTRGDSTSHQTLSPSAPRWRRAMRRPARIGILLCLGLSVLLMLAGRPEFGGRIDGPAQSGGNGSLAPEQVSVSPPAVVASSPKLRRPPHQPRSKPRRPPIRPPHQPWPKPRRPPIRPPHQPWPKPRRPPIRPPHQPWPKPRRPPIRPPHQPWPKPRRPPIRPPHQPWPKPRRPPIRPPHQPWPKPRRPPIRPPHQPWPKPRRPPIRPPHQPWPKPRRPPIRPPHQPRPKPRRPPIRPPHQPWPKPAADRPPHQPRPKPRRPPIRPPHQPWPKPRRPPIRPPHQPRPKPGGRPFRPR